MPASRKSNKPALAKWTVMLFMAADTTTDDNKPDDKFNEEALKDLMEIKAVGSTEEVNFLAQWDGIGKTTPVYHLRKGTKLEEDMIHKVREVNMGDIKTLLGFFDTCTEAYPAEHYMFIIWGHGNGWTTDNFWDKKHIIPPSSVFHHTIAAWRVRGFSPGGVLPDKTVKGRKVDYLDSFELLEGFKKLKRKLHKNLDILGFDACLMGMIEGAYQFRETVDHVIFSEDLQYSTDGWPYGDIATLLTTNPDTKAEDLAVFVVKQFVRKYEFEYPVTLSACDMKDMNVVAETIKKLTKLLTDLLTVEPPKDSTGDKQNRYNKVLKKRLRFDDVAYQAFKLRKAIWQARREVQQYDFPPDPNIYLPDNVDLYHFCRLLRTHCDVLEIKDACREVMKALADKAFLCSGVAGEKVSKSYGLAIYFPTDQVNRYYHNLGFAKKTKWDKFLSCFLDKEEWGNFLAYDVYYAQTED